MRTERLPLGRRTLEDADPSAVFDLGGCTFVREGVFGWDASSLFGALLAEMSDGAMEVARDVQKKGDMTFAASVLPWGF